MAAAGASAVDGQGMAPMWKTVMSANVRAKLGLFYSEAELEVIRERLAVPPLNTCIRVNTTRCTREELMGELREELGKMGQGLAYGEIVAHPVVPDAILIIPEEKSPRVIERMQAEVIVSRKCAESVLRGANVFVPGVVATSPHVAKGEKVTVLCDVFDRILRGVPSHVLATGKLDPRRLRGSAMKGVDMSLDENKRQFRIGKGRIEVSADPNAPPPPLPDGIIILGNGIAQVDRKDMFAAKDGLGVVMEECVFSAPPLNGLLLGKMYVQNLPSLCVAHALAPQDGERIIDMCASPGGKTTHIAALMHGTGEVIGIDRTQVKIDIIKQWAADLNLPNIKAMKADSTILLPMSDQEMAEAAAKKTPKKKGDKESAQVKVNFEEESFDRVLLDPPCTAFGLRPRLLVDANDHDLDSTHLYQRQMLSVAVKLLKPGGRLVFSTCTINVLENEANVAWALETFPLELIKPPLYVGEPGRKGAGLSEEDRHKVQVFGPNTSLDTNGFFISAFNKTTSTLGVKFPSAM